MARRRSAGQGGGGFGWPGGPVSPERWLRRRRWLVALVVLGIGSLIGYDRLRQGPAPAPAPPDLRDDMARYNGQTFRVVKAVDGDTLHIDSPDKGKAFTTVRLWGVDTPEVHGVEKPDHFGPEASRFAHSQCDGRSVRLELVPGRARDRYGRLLAYVYLPDGTMLNERLVAEGYAYADTRFSHRLRAKFVKLEQQARAARAGLWEEVTVDDMPAWRRKLETKAEAAE